MNLPPDSLLLRIIPRLLAGFVFLSTTHFIIIWLFFPEAKEMSAGSMKFNTCLGLWILSLCLFGLGTRNFSLLYVRILSALVLFLGLYTLFEYRFSLSGTIDEIFVTDFRKQESQLYPGRMSPIAAILFALTGAGFLLKSIPRLAPVGFYFFLPAYFISFLALMGYIFGHSDFYQYGKFIRIAWQTALCFHLLCIGVFYLRHRNVTNILTSRGPGGLIARRLLPTVVGLPIFLGYLWIMARDRNWVTREFGISLFVLIVITVLIIVISFIARRLDQLEKERLDLEARASITHRRFIQVVENSPLVVWLIDRDGVLTLCDGGALSPLGATSSDFLGKNFFELNENNPTIVEHVRRCLKGESFFGETQYKDRDYSSHYAPVFEDGVITGVSVISLDITDLRKAEKSFLTERMNLQELFRSTPEVFGIFTGPDLVFEFVNDSLKALFKFDPTGMKVREARPDSKGMLKALGESYQTGKSINLNEVQVPSGSEFRFLNMTIAPRKDTRGMVDGLMFLGLDVTDLVLARDKLRKAVESRDEFLSMASHELKTPITSFLLQLQVMDKLRKTGDKRTYDVERVNNLIDLSIRQLYRINRLVEDMLDISRINSGKLSFRMKPESLSEAVNEIVARMGLIFEAEKIEFTHQVEGGLTINMDRVRIEQIVNNILTNALRYGEKKPVSLTLESKGEFAELTVKDNGIGIAPHDIDRIFNRFERGISNSEVSGLGLGLFISQQIVFAHQGSIMAMSEGPGRGSTITIQLPLLK